MRSIKNQLSLNLLYHPTYSPTHSKLYTHSCTYTTVTSFLQSFNNIHIIYPYMDYGAQVTMSTVHNNDLIECTNK